MSWAVRPPAAATVTEPARALALRTRVNTARVKQDGMHPGWVLVDDQDHPDLKAVQGVDPRYWDYDAAGKRLVPMTAAQRARADADDLSDAAKGTVRTEPGLVALHKATHKRLLAVEGAVNQIIRGSPLLRIAELPLRTLQDSLGEVLAELS